MTGCIFVQQVERFCGYKIMSASRFPRKRSKYNKGTITRFEGQVAIITGAASGIGQACAIRLASEGAFIYCLDVNNADETIDKIGKSKGKFFKLDVTKFDQVKSVIDDIYNERGYIDILVQCAGIAGNPGYKTHLVDNDDFIKTFMINTYGIFNVCKATIPYMLKENYGRIINVASISGKEGNPGQSCYSTSKGGVIALTKTMGKDYAKTGIIVNSIAPAVIYTKMVEKVPQSQVDMMTSKIPMARCGELDEVSAVIAFMASEENSFSTGFCFDLTGGRATY